MTSNSYLSSETLHLDHQGSSGWRRLRWSARCAGTSWTHSPLKAETKKRNKLGFSPDKIYAGHSFCYGWFLSLWKICWATSPSRGIGWRQPVVVTKTLGYVWWNKRPWYSVCVRARVTRPGKSFLCDSTRMDKLSIDQLLVRVRAIMKDEVMEEGQVVTAVQTTRDETWKLPTGDPCDSILCYRSNCPIDFPKYCKGLHIGGWKLSIRYHKWDAVGHISRNCPEKRVKRIVSALAYSSSPI